jgi:hypothetical protein
MKADGRLQIGGNGSEYSAIAWYPFLLLSASFFSVGFLVCSVNRAFMAIIF